MLLNKWFNEPERKSKVKVIHWPFKVIHWPWSKVIQIQTFSNFFSLEIARLEYYQIGANDDTGLTLSRFYDMHAKKLPPV